MLLHSGKMFVRWALLTSLLVNTFKSGEHYKDFLPQTSNWMALIWVILKLSKLLRTAECCNIYHIVLEVVPDQLIHILLTVGRFAITTVLFWSRITASLYNMIIPTIEAAVHSEILKWLHGDCKLGLRCTFYQKMLPFVINILNVMLDDIEFQWNIIPVFIYQTQQHTLQIIKTCSMLGSRLFY